MRSFWLKSVVPSCLCLAAAAQVPTALNLRQITSGAGYIFSGTVIAVARVSPSEADQAATMRITFRVDQAVRGVRARQTLVIREWEGLWNAGERYYVGERVLLALYPPSKLGLTSPVGAGLGRFPLDRNGELAPRPEQAQALASDPVIGPWLRGKTRVNGRDFARMLRRVVKE